MKNLYSVLIIALLASCQSTLSKNEILSKALHALEQIEAAEFIFEGKHNVPFYEDSIVNTGYSRTYYQTREEDSIRGSISKVESFDAEGKVERTVVYDGRFDLELDHRRKKAEIEDWEKYDEFYERDTYLEPALLRITQLLKHVISDENAEVVKLKDSVINEQACYRLKITFKDQQAVPFLTKMWLKESPNEYEVYTLALSKQNFLPVYHERNNYEIIDGAIERGPYSVYSFQEIKVLNKAEAEPIDALAAIPQDYSTAELIPNSYQPWLGLPLNEAAPVWQLPAIQGDSVSLSQHEGKLLLLEFTSISCGPCYQTIPKVKNIHEKYKDKGLKVVAVEAWVEKEEALKKFVNKYELPYPYLYLSKEVSKAYKVKMVPAFYLIDQKGNIVYRTSGNYENTEAKLTQAIDKYI